MILLESMPIPEGMTGHEAGRQLLEKLFREHTGEELPPIAVTSRGKPYFPSCNLHFSISHTPLHVFCALSSCPVGIDAEELDRPVRKELAHRVLSTAEMQRYLALGGSAEAFLRMWVLKEATAKCSGQGLQGFPNDTDFSPADPRVSLRDGCVVAVVQG